MTLLQNDVARFKSISTFSETEKGHYMAGLISGDGYFSERGELSIAFHRKDRIAIENIIKALNAGVISDLKKEQTSKLRFNGKDLKKMIKLINGKLVGTVKVLQLVESKIAEKFQIIVKPALLSIDVNNYWLAGFLDADGSVSIALSQPNSKKFNWTLRVEINFSQKNPELLYLIAALFPGKKVYKNPLKDGRVCYSVPFSSMKDFPFWIHYLTLFHLQGRKYWQFLKVKECFALLLEAQNSSLQFVTREIKLTLKQKKQTRDKLIANARQLQVELRAMIIPESIREKVIPMFINRYSLTLLEMDQIDDFLQNSKLTFTKIAQKVNISRDLLYRYRQNPDRYRSKPLIDPEFRRQNTKLGKKSPK